MTVPTVGVIGGGPGGLLTAYRLQQEATVPYRTTILEASPRLGGKILTRTFQTAPLRYEAGAAELYDYSIVGVDPLRELVAELDLTTTLMDGHKVVMNQESWDASACKSLDWFDQQAHAWITPQQFYDSDWKDNTHDPLAQQSFSTVLAQLSCAQVRRYVQTLIHSDLATEPHLTNGTYGLQNYLMNDPAYMRLYSIEGGIEQLPRALAERIEANIALNCPIHRVGRKADGRLRVTTHEGELNFDYVVLALPHDALAKLHWEGDVLAHAMQQHLAHYAYPAHYLRVTVLFDRPFWRDFCTESFFMLDAFGGCCVYDESARHVGHTQGVLGWLLAGEPARELSSLSDDALIDQVLATLPASFPKQPMREAHVHRWIGAVNGLPSGYPTKPLSTRHQPEPRQHPNLFVVGDYLFDSTLNGVLDSATTVAEWLAGELGHQSYSAWRGDQ